MKRALFQGLESTCCHSLILEGNFDNNILYKLVDVENRYENILVMFSLGCVLFSV